MYGDQDLKNVANQAVHNIVQDVNNPSHILFLHPYDNRNNVLNNLSVADYFIKIKKMWDDYSNMSGYNPEYQSGYNHNVSQSGYYSGYNFKNVQKSTGQDRRQFFLVTIVVGHIIQRCYKIHSYPPGHKFHKGRKMAATIHNDSIGFSSAQDMPFSQASTAVSALISEQYS
ncbi:LOW QUALITY PROTEIN: hypothetical protein Cgig2_015430 [Carnegiea gigantea]|uniref:Uncharacterized protein n=1 Tax=Carnegiea gigantea TaxID=171969 RepID=A0A9Q1JYC4_9CARY|nr:LOW QUALITY PROTEIN: hypothetical protein Cgig2_015430 [Carnegiea gigantea]